MKITPSAHNYKKIALTVAIKKKKKKTQFPKRAKSTGKIPRHWTYRNRTGGDDLVI